MKSLHSWVLRFALIGVLALFFRTTPANAAPPTWQDVPNNVFDRMACFDGVNAEVIWANDGNAYLWKTSTKLTNYVLPDNRISSTTWCSDDGWFYNTEMTTVYDATTSSYAYTDFKLLRRSLTQAPVLVTTLANDITTHHTDSTGNTSLITKNNQQITVLQSTDGISWRNRISTFSDTIVDIHIATHDVSHVYVMTMPRTAFTENETLPRNRTVSQLTIWKTSNAGQRWQKTDTNFLAQTVHDLRSIRTWAMWATTQITFYHQQIRRHARLYNCICHSSIPPRDIPARRRSLSK